MKGGTLHAPRPHTRVIHHPTSSSRSSSPTSVPDSRSRCSARVYASHPLPFLCTSSASARRCLLSEPASTRRRRRPRRVAAVVVVVILGRPRTTQRRTRLPSWSSSRTGSVFVRSKGRVVKRPLPILLARRVRSLDGTSATTTSSATVTLHGHCQLLTVGRTPLIKRRVYMNSCDLMVSSSRAACPLALSTVRACVCVRVCVHLGDDVVQHVERQLLLRVRLVPEADRRVLVGAQPHDQPHRQRRRQPPELAQRRARRLRRGRGRQTPERPRADPSRSVALSDDKEATSSRDAHRLRTHAPARWAGPSRSAWARRRSRSRGTPARPPSARGRTPSSAEEREAESATPLRSGTTRGTTLDHPIRACFPCCSWCELGSGGPLCVLCAQAQVK